MVILILKINPLHLLIGKMSNAKPDLGVGITRFRISLLFQITIYIGRSEYWKDWNFSLIKTHENNFSAIRTPPESPVAATPAQNFFIIHPGCVSVQNVLIAILSELCGTFILDIKYKQITLIGLSD